MVTVSGKEVIKHERLKRADVKRERERERERERDVVGLAQVRDSVGRRKLREVSLAKSSL